ncbi:oligopeptide ABC transporter (ATP-binding protein) [Candidatus Hydrogenisulfobacillus filiaventi]|uniref:Oligopeptide ABC transporter (ATP-binding protein) n=1 Tax=Candidatus Hydrogenisulfobacillus filiaventi TaxID=2707344 RepID=A0A6F8ZH87_9FIRM|nr:ABC transporter ATP-binding protein [Bacillota bacterium]CAB1129247.1 oligopeptide ABC transporter (ATP-binding protein) [Candidatus Hydrogenisulfobacillus filiaventi]
MSGGDQPLLEVEGLVKEFVRRNWAGRRTGAVRAVDGVSFHLRPGETLALVGESGAGKSTTARAALRLIEPTAGRVRLLGRDLLALPARDLRRLRREVQWVFQDPYTSLNPRLTAGAILAEPLVIHRVGTPRQRQGIVAALLEQVGLHPADAGRFPHEFSGGQRQRLAIARALALRPRLVVADEPVSALDVSVQAQVLDLLAGLQQTYRLTYLLIAHGLGVVRRMADRVAVLYQGRLVETGPAEAVFTRPLHPYTRALFAAVPLPDPEARTRPLPAPAGPSGPAPGAGCPYQSRCPWAEARCRQAVPPLRAVLPGHQAACHLA